MASTNKQKYSKQRCHDESMIWRLKRRNPIVTSTYLSHTTVCVTYKFITVTPWIYILLVAVARLSPHESIHSSSGTYRYICIGRQVIHVCLQTSSQYYCATIEWLYQRHASIFLCYSPSFNLLTKIMVKSDDCSQVSRNNTDLLHR